MLEVINLSVIFPDKKLFEDVNLKFSNGNCYGVIGANGAGKSTFLKILSKEIDSTKGDVIKDKHARMSVLKQNHYEFDNHTVMDTVLMGYPELYKVTKEREKLYSKTEFTEEDGIKASELESEYADLNGWDAESDVKKLLSELGLGENVISKKMEDLQSKAKVKVLLAQALFSSPDIILMDEPTNGLDFKSIAWLEDFLIDYDKTVIVVSHDRHFLNKVCTHMVDIDYGEAKLYPGNYDFWYESSQLLIKMAKEGNKKKEQRIKELEDFIARFSANASKSKQATSRKKSLEKIELEELKPSSRKYPFIDFSFEKSLGKDIVKVTKLSKTIDGIKVLDNVSFMLANGDKLAIISDDDVKTTTLLKILAGEIVPDSGEIKWGQTVNKGYLPIDNSNYFHENNDNLIKWLSNYSSDGDERYLRSFLGRMLFSGDEPLKSVKVLSGGEKVRCMLSKAMIEQSNTLLLDQPTNHLDLESIESLNRGLIKFKGSIIFSSHDHKFVDSVANKILEIKDEGSTFYNGTLDEYLSR